MNPNDNMKKHEGSKPEEQLQRENSENATTDPKPVSEAQAGAGDSTGGESVSPDLETRLAEAEQRAASYKDLFLRKAAEFENYKRRMENENALTLRYAHEELLQALLPLVDDLERSLKNAHDVKTSPFFAGVELIYQKMLKVLQSFNVRPFETVGKEFDVRYHDALLQIPRKGVPPHTILEEVERGYLYHDKVLRHAKVIVSADAGDGEEVNAAGHERTTKEE
ncbi:MAG: nucleotide exchange factor GrpE [Ignavibacteriales bacterium]|nr:nucleotide exchange factor GrpE [Ignavibacteriales bacterium]